MPSLSHLIVIPSYNPGPQVFDTVRTARAQWSPVWGVVRGSTDGSAEALREPPAPAPGAEDTEVVRRSQVAGSGLPQVEPPGLTGDVRRGD